MLGRFSRFLQFSFEVMHASYVCCLRFQNCCVSPWGFAQDLLNGQMLYVKLAPGFGAECFVSHETLAKVEPRVEARADRRADGG